MFGKKRVDPEVSPSPVAGAWSGAAEVGSEPASVAASSTSNVFAGGSPNESRLDALKQAAARIQATLYQRIDTAAAAKLPKPELRRQVAELAQEIALEQRYTLSAHQQQELTSAVVDEMVGLGPLEALLKDDSVSDIMVNGPSRIYVERRGKIELTNLTFRDNQHVMNIAQRIVSRVGRRLDESTPICDARLDDGSRVNVISPPLALDGCAISIRKFPSDNITLDRMVHYRSLDERVSKLLQIVAACRLNVVISGGTGSGKTTLLNALSQLIDPRERIVTLEDAAELRLMQPHVVRLETRPPNLEGQHEVTMRALVRNALRMRPDRIICGEVRGPEAYDMLQAMNTGHDGSMCTLHANSPREAITRIENMVGMAAPSLPVKAIRNQILGAVHLIVQVSRMRDGIRRVTQVTEVLGMEGEIITLQDLVKFTYVGDRPSGEIEGVFEFAGNRPSFTPRAAYYGLDRALGAILHMP